MTHGDYSGSEVPLVPGTLRVYRQWQAADVLDLGGAWIRTCACGACVPIFPGAHLIPMNFPQPWVDGENVAVCQETHRMFSHVGPETEVPGRECQCGFYGTHEPTASWKTSPSLPSGVVEVYGRVIIGTQGVRAQKARIVAVSMRHHPGVRSGYSDQLMERYPSVDWISSPDEILDKYPPQNIDEILGVDTLAAVIKARRQEEIERWKGLRAAFLEARPASRPDVSFAELAQAIKNLEERARRSKE